MSDIKEIFKESIRKVVASINPGTADISGIGDGTIKGAIRELNGKISGIEGKTIFTSVVGTTDSSGLITIQCNNAFTSYPFALSNVSDTLATPYSVTVNAYTKETVTLRIRSMVDNSAITNKSVNFTVLLIGK